MRHPKDPKLVELETAADAAMIEVFEALRAHRGALGPPALAEAYERYRGALTAELLWKEGNSETES